MVDWQKLLAFALTWLILAGFWGEVLYTCEAVKIFWYIYATFFLILLIVPIIVLIMGEKELKETIEHHITTKVRP